MAVGVVNALEAIHIHGQQGIGGVVALGAVILAATAVHNQPSVRKAGELVMGGCFFQRLVEVVEHRLITIGDSNRLLQLADLQVVALGNVLHSLMDIRLIAIRNLGDALQTQQLLPHALHNRFQGVAQWVVAITFISQQQGNALL